MANAGRAAIDHAGHERVPNAPLHDSATTSESARRGRSARRASGLTRYPDFLTAGNYIAVVGLAVNSTSVAYGAGCEKLYISGVPISFPGVSDSYGSTGPVYFGLTNGLLPVNPAFIGLTVIAQDAWNDTTTNAAMISAACANKMPALTGLLSVEAAKRFCRYDYSGDGPASNFSPFNSVNAICRYN